MLLSCRFLNDVKDVNSYETVPAIEYYAGDQQNLYIQLIDASLDRESQGFQPGGRRYVPAPASTMRVTLKNINDAKVIYRAGVQAFPTSDPSIWFIPILSSDPLEGTVTMAVTVVEPEGVVHSFVNQKGVLLRVR